MQTESKVMKRNLLERKEIGRGKGQFDKTKRGEKIGDLVKNEKVEKKDRKMRCSFYVCDIVCKCVRVLENIMISCIDKVDVRLWHCYNGV